MGHRRIAHIVGPRLYHCVVERYAGYRQALASSGITPDPAFVLQGDFEIESGRQIALRLFARDRADWPSAIFAANDQMAFGVLEVAAQRAFAFQTISRSLVSMTISSRRICSRH